MNQFEVMIILKRDHYYNRCLQGVEGVARVAGGVAKATLAATPAPPSKIKPPHEFQ